MRSRKEAYTTAILEDDNISETATGGNAGYQRTTPPPATQAASRRVRLRILDV